MMTMIIYRMFVCSVENVCDKVMTKDKALIGSWCKMSVIKDISRHLFRGDKYFNATVCSILMTCY